MGSIDASYDLEIQGCTAQDRQIHFDLRLIDNDLLRSWSLLKQPPLKTGERRLAIERETRARPT